MGTEGWLNHVDLESSIVQSGEYSLYFWEMIINVVFSCD